MFLLEFVDEVFERREVLRCEVGSQQDVLHVSDLQGGTGVKVHHFEGNYIKKKRFVYTWYSVNCRGASFVFHSLYLHAEGERGKKE